MFSTDQASGLRHSYIHITSNFQLVASDSLGQYFIEITGDYVSAVVAVVA
jgi:hypothetical protein